MRTPDSFQSPSVRRVPADNRRGMSGLGLLLVVCGLLLAALTFAGLAHEAAGLWPLCFVLVGLFGMLRRPGWIQELDWRAGGQASRLLDRSRRLFSLALLLFGLFCLPFTLHWVDARLIGPALLIALGLGLVWRRTR